MNRAKYTISVLMSMVFLLLAYGGHARAQDPYFPELVFFPKDRDINSIVDDLTSVHLRAMKEPSLWKLSTKDRTANISRLLWLATGEHPICARFTRTGRDFALHVTGHDGPPGLTAGRLTINKDVKLSRQQGEKLDSLLGKTPFWTAPVEVKESLGWADVDRIVLEGVKGGKYHVINRGGTATGEAYKAFCRSLLELADEPGVLKAWDGWRRDDRQLPGYRPEPTQSEDLGEPVPDPDAP